jgi:hypothetical protein
MPPCGEMCSLATPVTAYGWTVLVLADRGLYVPWLFRRITRLG